jgi:hypothetical protein
MIRAITVAIIASAVAVSACDNAAAEQNKATAAQTKANEKIAAAGQEADIKIKAAQADADKKIAAAQADFAKLREDFRHTTTKDLVDLDKKIADLTAKSKTATGKAKADLDANLRGIASSREAFAIDFRSIEVASAVTWDATKARLEKQWKELTAQVDKA